MVDRYDEAIEYFRKNPDETFRAWCAPSLYAYGFLFRYLTPDGIVDHINDVWCGCPSQIKHSQHYHASNDELTEAVRNGSKEIPNVFDAETDEQRRDKLLAGLDAIADVQRLADKVLNRSTDSWLPVVLQKSASSSEMSGF